MPSLEPAQLLLLATGRRRRQRRGRRRVAAVVPGPAGRRLPALTANVTNSVALTPGYLGGTVGYRRELAGQRARILALGATSATGAVVGAFLLLVSSAALFERIVPLLIFLACGLLAAQPRLARLVRERREDPGGGPTPSGRAGLDGHTVALFAAQFLAAVYGAYFGAGVGIMMLAILGIFVADTLQRLNALKGLMSLLVAVVAAVAFALFADVSWVAVAVMAAASLLGGQLGVMLARRLNDQACWLVIAFGITVGVYLLVTS